MELEDEEIIERYLLLLLGASEFSIPSETHVQKELFLITKVNQKAETSFRFEKHYFGPFSIEVEELLKSPMFFPGAFEWSTSGRIKLSKKGREFYNKIIEEYGEDSKFKVLLALIKMTRQLYDRLSTDELLFLIYIAYDEYTEKSVKSESLLSNPKRGIIAKKLLAKGLISKEKYDELVTVND